MMESSPRAPLEMAQPQLLLERQVIALHDPAVLGQRDQLDQRRLGRQVRQPVLGRLRGPARPLRQQPQLGVRLGAPVFPMGRRRQPCAAAGPRPTAWAGTTARPPAGSPARRPRSGSQPPGSSAACPTARRTAGPHPPSGGPSSGSRCHPQSRSPRGRAAGSPQDLPPHGGQNGLVLQGERATK